MKNTYNTLKKVSLALATLFLTATASILATVVPYAWRVPYLIGLVIGSVFALWVVWVAKNW